MVEGERNEAVWEFSLSNKRLVIETVRADMVEASLAVTSACLNKSIVECMEFHRLLVEAWG